MHVLLRSRPHLGAHMLHFISHHPLHGGPRQPGICRTLVECQLRTDTGCLKQKLGQKLPGLRSCHGADPTELLLHDSVSRGVCCSYRFEKKVAHSIQTIGFNGRSTFKCTSSVRNDWKFPVYWVWGPSKFASTLIVLCGKFGVIVFRTYRFHYVLDSNLGICE